MKLLENEITRKHTRTVSRSRVHWRRIYRWFTPTPIRSSRSSSIWCSTPSRLLEDIFNPFFTTKDKGTGLGLSIAHQIISEHGGFIAVTSEEGRGSSFCLNLPATKSEPAMVDDAEAALPIGYGRMGKL